jgi:hypothetical protein
MASRRKTRGRKEGEKSATMGDVKPRDTRGRAFVASVALLLLASVVLAQQPTTSGSDIRDLATTLSNPISDLVSVPFHFNWEQNVGPSELTRFVLNVQPVIPFNLNEDLI